VAGTETNVRSFNREHFLKYRKEHYVGGATTVIIAGAFDERAAEKAVEKIFAGVSAGTKAGKVPVKEAQTEPRVQTEFKETDQTHLVIGVRTFPVLDERMPAAGVLSTILGRGMSSRLFSKMRDELGICYYVKADHDPFTDHGILSISAGIDNARVEEGVKGILEECRRLKSESVSAAELKKAKDYIAGTTMLELETSDARAEFCGYQEILKKTIEGPDQVIAKINKVSAAEVRKLADQIFVDDKLNMALIGRFKDGEAFKSYFKLA
jgi:predicted Zn-dependent peptidase